MKKQFFLLFIVLLLFPMFVKADSSDYYDYFYKEDEQGNYISDAEFIIRNLNNTVQYEVTYDTSYKAYRYANYIEEDFDKTLKLLPNNLKDIINGFNNLDDIVPYINVVAGRSTIGNFKSMSVFCEKRNDDLGSLDSEYNIKNMVYSNDYNTCTIVVPIVMFIEETKTPKGFEKETRVITSYLWYEYRFDEENGNILNRYSDVALKEPAGYKDENNEEVKLYYLYKYDENLNYTDIESVYNTLANYSADMKGLYTACTYSKSAPKVKKQSTINNYSIKKMDSNIFVERLCTPIIVDKRGTSSLNIVNYVNNEEETTIEDSNTVTIKVFLKNDGKAPSYDNVIVSKVPAGVEYVPNSATDNGVYSDNNNTVTWNLDYLDSEETHTFTYDVIVPKGKSSIYVTTSSVSSDDTETPIGSNEAKVTTSGKALLNPKTGDARSSIIVVLLIISFSALYYSFTKKTYNI